MQKGKNKRQAQRSLTEQKQTTSLRIFNNPEFGDIRVQLNEKGEPIFCLLDLCNALGLSNPGRV